MEKLSNAKDHGKRHTNIFELLERFKKCPRGLIAMQFEESAEWHARNIAKRSIPKKEMEI